MRKTHQSCSFSCGSSILVELEIGDVGYYGGRKTEEPGEKPERTYYKLNPHMTFTGPTSFPGFLIWYRAGVEPRSQWCEACALTTAPSLLPIPAPGRNWWFWMSCFQTKFGSNHNHGLDPKYLITSVPLYM